MRILFVTLFFPPSRSAGTENYTQTVARGMAARGHDVRVVCARTWDTGPAYWNGVTEDRGSPVPVDGINLNWTRASDPNRVLFDSDEVERWFEQAVRRMEPDVVHVTSLMTLGLGSYARPIVLVCRRP